jgi:hypothetical protein
MSEEWHRAVQHAMTVASIDRELCVSHEQGSGVLLLVPQRYSAATLLRDMVRVLDGLLSVVRERSGADHRIRLRVGFADGPVAEHGGRPGGRAVGEVAELVGAEPVRRALRAVPDANMVVVVSDRIYQTVVTGGYRGIRAAEYGSFDIGTRERGVVRAWVRLPGGYRAPRLMPGAAVRGAGAVAGAGDAGGIADAGSGGAWVGAVADASAEDAAGYRDIPLGEGRDGVVYTVTRPYPGLPGHLAYKEYRPGRLADPQRLATMAAFPTTLSAADRAFLDSRLLWPLALGTRSGETSGFLMRRIPAEFLFDAPELPGPRPRGVELLLRSDAYLERLGLPVGRPQRLRLLKDLAEIIGRLHRHGVVVGDLAPHRVLFTVDVWPRCLLTHCDSMRWRGSPALARAESAGWEPPERGGPTPWTDMFKFGLMAVRMFAGDGRSRDSGPLGTVSPELEYLALLSMSPAPRQRPGFADWIAALERALEGRGMPDVVRIDVDAL